MASEPGFDAILQDAREIHLQTPRSLAKYAPASNECFLLLPVYLDIISASDPSYCVSTLNAHRLILAAVMISTKFTEDR